MHSIALIKVGHTKNSYRSGFLPDTPRQIRTYLLEFIWKIINPTKKKTFHEQSFHLAKESISEVINE